MGFGADVGPVFQIDVEISEEDAIDGDGILPAPDVAGVGGISVPGNSWLQAEMKSGGEIHQEGETDEQFGVTVADVLGGGGDFELRLDSEGGGPDGVAAFVSPEIELAADEGVAETGLAGGLIGGVIGVSEEIEGIDNGVEFEVIEDSEAEVELAEGEGFDSGVSTLVLIAIIIVIENSGFDLKVSGVDGVGGVGFVGPVGVHAAELVGRRGIEKVVLRFVGGLSGGVTERYTGRDEKQDSGDEGGVE